MLLKLSKTLLNHLYFIDFSIHGPDQKSIFSRRGNPVGRQLVLERAQVAMARVQRGRSEKSALLVGLRGVGKTVLLRTISDKSEELRCHPILMLFPIQSFPIDRC